MERLEEGLQRAIRKAQNLAEEAATLVETDADETKNQEGADGGRIDISNNTYNTNDNDTQGTKGIINQGTIAIKGGRDGNSESGNSESESGGGEGFDGYGGGLSSQSQSQNKNQSQNKSQSRNHADKEKDEKDRRRKRVTSSEVNAALDECEEEEEGDNMEDEELSWALQVSISISLSLSLSRRLRFRGLFLYTVGVLCNVGGALDSSAVLQSYNIITSTTQQHHTDLPSSKHINILIY